MQTTETFKDSLAQFYGTENYYVNPLYRWMKYTDGVKFFAENAGNGAYWLLDILGTELHALSKNEEFMNIELHVTGNNAKLIADDGNDRRIYQKRIDYTDCPEGNYRFYLTNEVLMLASEY